MKKMWKFSHGSEGWVLELYSLGWQNRTKGFLLRAVDTLVLHAFVETLDSLSGHLYCRTAFSGPYSKFYVWATSTMGADLMKTVPVSDDEVLDLVEREFDRTLLSRVVKVVEQPDCG